MDSHIQMPKCILKEFVNKEKFFYKFNAENSMINVGFPKKTFTSEDYYSEAMEKFLNKHVETPLKALLTFSRALPTQDLPVVIPGNVIDLAITFIKSLVARSPVLMKSVSEQSDFLQLFKTRDQHDLVVDYALKNQTMPWFFEQFDLSFMINKTATPFVLPTRGLFEYSINGVLCLNVPLTPYCAIFMEVKGAHFHPGVETKDTLVEIPSGFDDVVLRLNSFAFERQIQDGTGYVVSHDKPLLEELKKSHN